MHLTVLVQQMSRWSNKTANCSDQKKSQEKDSLLLISVKQFDLTLLVKRILTAAEFVQIAVDMH